MEGLNTVIGSINDDRTIIEEKGWQIYNNDDLIDGESPTRDLVRYVLVR